VRRRVVGVVTAVLCAGSLLCGCSGASGGAAAPAPSIVPHTGAAVTTQAPASPARTGGSTEKSAKAKKHKERRKSRGPLKPKDMRGHTVDVLRKAADSEG